MNDPVVRKAFHSTILTHDHNKPDTFVVDELGLRNGQIRADIAVLNGKLIGYEIKTEKDSLARLSNQVLAYNEVFDKVYIITAHSHLNKVINIVPSWWGVYLINSKESQCYFSLYRKPQLNKWRSCLGLAQLLWKDEVIGILQTEMRLKIKTKDSKEDLYEMLSGICASNRLSKLVIACLKNREGWRKDPVTL